MELSQLADIGAFIGGIGVPITLLFVALQMRQNILLAKGSAQRELMSNFQINLDRIRSNPALFQRGLNNFDDLSNEEKLTFQMIFNQLINHLEQPLRMKELGLESGDNVDIYGNVCLSLILEPGGKAIWEKGKTLFFPKSRAYIEERLLVRSTLPPKITSVSPWLAPDTDNNA